MIDGPAGLLAVEVPAGEHTLQLDHRTPGLRLGAFAAGAAALVVVVRAGVWWALRSRRRRRGRGALTLRSATRAWRPRGSHSSA